METIQSAAFVISLDNGQPNKFEEHSEWLWHGGKWKIPHSHAFLGMRNRWADKPVQFVVYDNGKAGLMGEHSVMDGTPTVTLCDRVLDMIADPHFDAGAPAADADADADAASAVAPPQPFRWTLDEPMARRLRSAEAEVGILINQQELGVVRTAYGKAAVKQFGVGPDSWAQMLVQLAYARLLARQTKKRRGGTYEAAMTRRFFKGRTEAIRVVTSESDAWVASMMDESVGDAQRLELFRAAVQKHVQLAKEAGNGMGIDRHLLGRPYPGFRMRACSDTGILLGLRLFLEASHSQS